MGAPNSSNNWDVGLSAWIVQDGNYPDFEVGQAAEFALEFWLPEEVVGPASGRNISANNLGNCLYDAVAEVVFQTAEITILDIGVLVYLETSALKQSLPEGRRLAIRLGLGVDPFFYLETLSKIAEVPPLVYSWKILSILRQTAPFIETMPEAGPLIGRAGQVRDPQRLGYEELLKTDAWNDDGGRAEYILRCELLPIPPKHVIAIAT